MPRRKKEQLRRRLAQAYHDLDRCKSRLASLWGEFRGVHDDYAEYLAVMAAGADQLQELIRDFWARAWGRVPDNLDSYRR